MDDETFKKELNKMFSEIHEILKPKRWSSPNLEPTPIKVNSGSDLVSHMLNLSELERGEPEHEPRPLEEEIKLPDLTIVIGLSQLHEASVEASIDTKVNSQQEIPKPWSDKPPRHIENKLRTSSEETRKLTYGEDETLNGGRRIGCRFNGDLRLGEERVRKWGFVLMEVCREKEEDLYCVEERRSVKKWASVFWSEGKKRFISRVINKLGQLGYYCNCQFLQLCWAFLRP
ncbi:hypothetical protein QYF36_011830 [Acer negundo]|nr:hypothetical protein QYF36_011830 [Acer negundo]